MTKIVPIILAGGVGTRLWPLSCGDTPKQFAPLMSKRSMFQDTLDRLRSAAWFEPPVVICSEKHLPIVRRQLEEAGVEAAAVLAETAARDSGPAVAIAALHAAAEPIRTRRCLVLPSDHLIEQPAGFEKTVLDGLPAAQDGHIVVFGVKATRPGNRLRLHPLRRPARRRRRGVRGRQLRREARSRHGLRIPGRRRLFLEQRHGA